MANERRPASAPPLHSPTNVPLSNRNIASKSLSTTVMDDVQGGQPIRMENRTRRSATKDDEPADVLALKRTAKTTRVVTQPPILVSQNTTLQQQTSSKKVIKWLYLPPLEDDDDDSTSKSSNSDISARSSRSSTGMKLKRVVRQGHEQNGDSDQITGAKVTGPTSVSSLPGNSGGASNLLKSVNGSSIPSTILRGTISSVAGSSIRQLPLDANSLSKLASPTPVISRTAAGPSASTGSKVKHQSSITKATADPASPPTTNIHGSSGAIPRLVVPTQTLQSDLERDLMELNRLLSKSGKSFQPADRN